MPKYKVCLYISQEEVSYKYISLTDYQHYFYDPNGKIHI